MHAVPSPLGLIGKRPALGVVTDGDVAIPAAADVAVVGAGVIGLSIAWRLALRGLAVAVFERDTVGAGASLAATGMLAAAAEHEPGCHDLLALALESQRQWPQFRADLEMRSGQGIDFREGGTLVVASGGALRRLSPAHLLRQRMPSVYRVAGFIHRGRCSVVLVHPHRIAPRRLNHAVMTGTTIATSDAKRPAFAAPAATFGST